MRGRGRPYARRMHATQQVDPTTADVLAILEGIYRGYLQGDTTSIDRHLADGITMFDSAAPDLVVNHDGLAQLRAARPAESHEDSGPDVVSETALAVENLATRTVGGVVVATWWLRVDGTDASGESVIPELSRNSAVLVRGSAGDLVIEHLHEDVWQSLGGPAALRTPASATA